jgi:hypothetical protein
VLQTTDGVRCSPQSNTRGTLFSPNSYRCATDDVIASINPFLLLLLWDLRWQVIRQLDCTAHRRLLHAMMTSDMQPEGRTKMKQM